MSPPQMEQRPRDAAPERRSEDSAATKPLELFEADSRAGRTPVATQLRRRRQASLRCEPLHDGLRDPWSSSRPEEHHDRDTIMVPRTLHVEIGARTAWVRGRDGQDVFTLLDAVGIERRQWDAERKLWMIPVAYADDVMAWAEWRQRRTVTCEAVDR